MKAAEQKYFDQINLAVWKNLHRNTAFRSLFLVLVFYGFSMLLNAQVSDDFNDGDFTQNPSWTGSVNLFKVNTSKQLQLNDNQPGEAYLATANTMALNTEWRFWVKISFSPSGNNNARIYLLSDKPDFDQQLNGYFLQLGEAGGNDAVELFRQRGTETLSVCRGADGLIASSFTLRIKVIRDAEGYWQVFADPAGGENFTLQCEGTDNTHKATAFLGFYCKYTVSNSSKFYFDDVYAGEIIVDNEPPVLLSLGVESENSLSLFFNEPLDKTTAEQTANYLVSQEIGNPATALLADPAKAGLVFDKPFTNGQNYLLFVSGVQDLAGNTMESTEIPFSFYRPQPFDVVFNEIMADPTPVVGLPDREYLELFNRTGNIIDLNGWTLTIGSSVKQFETVTIAPGAYLILADEDAEALLGNYGPFYGFGSFTLSNAGQSLLLRDADGVLVSAVSYSDSWYNDPDKSDGGWSLEQINPGNICSGAENWKASTDPRGGSPGTLNAVSDEQVFLPALSRLEMPGSNSLSLFFSQRMDAGSLSDLSAYTVDQSVGAPAEALTFEEEPEKVQLLFAKDFEEGKIYELTVSKQIENCNGLQPAGDTVIAFGLPAAIGPGDVLINEVLFNPWTGGADYVEVYNFSGKVLDLQSLQLGTVKNSPPNPPDTAFYRLTDKQRLFIPGEYLVLTSSPADVKAQYFTSNPAGFLEVSPYPAYNNDRGTVLLFAPSGMVDAFDYAEDMHYPLLNYVDGVSLERTRFDSPTGDRNNWHSAAESVGFGTPAYQNSQFIPDESKAGEITIQPEIFSPDNDGYNDLIGIRYNFSQAGCVMNVSIFDATGQLVRKLVNNAYLGASGVVNWDGIRDDNTKAPVGIYVFYIEVFDLDGNVKKYKKVGVLASKL